MYLGFKPGAAEWYGQMKPRSYGGHPSLVLFPRTFLCHKTVTSCHQNRFSANGD